MPRALAAAIRTAQAGNKPPYRFTITVESDLPVEHQGTEEETTTSTLMATYVVDTSDIKQVLRLFLYATHEADLAMFLDPYDSQPTDEADAAFDLALDALSRKGSR